jgi:hypothetical protein
MQGVLERVLHLLWQFASACSIPIGANRPYSGFIPLQVLHDMDVQQDSKVMSVNVLHGGYLAALAHGHTVASINIYNTTK